MQGLHHRSVLITLVGPRSITSGRGDYAEVINLTEDEQILNVIVRQRYNETFGMMTLASITANLKFRAQVGANAGVGDSDSYDGNLVPLSRGVGYEENPTNAGVAKFPRPRGCWCDSFCTVEALIQKDA
jgi:hypothetical protein